jgi:uncharacterized protein YkwD
MYDTQIIKLLIQIVDHAAKSNSPILNIQADKIINLCNIDRIKVGLSALQINSKLNELAYIKSKDMVEKDYFSHISPTYGSVFDMLHKQGVNYLYAGENLAIDKTSEHAFLAWMKSEAHKRNIMFPSFRETGIGIYSKGENSYVYTQIFTC